MHCLLHYDCTVFVQAQVKGVGQLQPPVARCYKPYVNWGLISRGMGKKGKHEETVTVRAVILKRELGLFVYWKEKTLRLSHPFTISSRSGLFVPGEERALLINLDRKEFAPCEPF